MNIYIYGFGLELKDPSVPFLEVVSGLPGYLTLLGIKEKHINPNPCCFWPFKEMTG